MGNHMPILRLTKTPYFKPNSVVVITGASSGIGKELALQYAFRKCRLLLAARSEDKLIEVKKLCEKIGSVANYVVCDVSQESNCKNLMEKCEELYGELDILILNAGVSGHFRFEDVADLSIYKKMIDINFFGYVYCTKYAFSLLKKNKGQIIVLSSLSGELGLPYRTAYCSSKFAVTGFFESLRIEQDNQNISITIICPPTVNTEMREHSLRVEKKDENQAHVEENKTTKREETKISVEECVKTIIESSDRRGRKIFFPFWPYLAVYLRPIYPDFVDVRLKKLAKL